MEKQTNGGKAVVPIAQFLAGSRLLPGVLGVGGQSHELKRGDYMETGMSQALSADHPN